MKETKIEKNENKINKRKRSDTLATKEESNKKFWEICAKAKLKASIPKIKFRKYKTDTHTGRQTDIHTDTQTDNKYKTDWRLEYTSIPPSTG